MPKIRLEILIDDPGEWCRSDDLVGICPLWSITGQYCKSGHKPTRHPLTFDWWERPQSCKNSEKHD